MPIKKAPSYVKNSFYLFLIQLSGYLVPILELPILSRALGPEKYGHILFANSIALISAVFIEYGFNLYATRLVSQNREDKNLIGLLFSNILVAKSLITLILFSLLLTVWFFTTAFEVFDTSMLGLIFLFMMAYGFSPYWYFQGREKILLISSIELSLRFVILMGLYVFIKTPEDYFLAFAIQAAMPTVNIFIQFFLVTKDINLKMPKWSDSINLLKYSFHAFVFRGAQNIGNSMYTAVIGVMGTAYQVGIFSPVERLTRAGVGFINPIASAAYPHMVSSFTKNKRSAQKEGLKILLFATAVSIVGALIGFILADFIIHLLFSEEFKESIGLLKWLIWVIPLKIYSQYISLLFLIPNQLEKLSSLAIVASIIVSLLLCVLLFPKFGVMGVVFAALTVELVQSLFLTVCLLKIFKK